jgi:hypothetical protein
MLKSLPHTKEYWEKNKPKRVGDQKVTTDDWNKVLLLLKRFNKNVSFDRIAKYYEKVKDRELTRNYLSFMNSRTAIAGLKEHTAFMTYIYDQEKKRQDNIDNKARQIISNISLVFTFIAFSSAILLSKDNYVKGISGYSFLSVIISLIIALTVLVIAILCLNVRTYSRPRQEIIFDPKYRGEEDFLRQKVSDFFFTLYVNTDTNTKKTKYIKVANWLFIISIGFIGVFTVLNLYSLKYRNENPIEKAVQEMKVKDTINVKIVK